MDITTLSLVELKALGFDILLDTQRNQQNLQLVQQQIAKLSPPILEKPE